jgi:hypothetical protein
MKIFAGWVPNITGQLSFSLIGLRAATGGCVTANAEISENANPPHRIVLLTQKRVTRDIPLPFRLGFPAREKQYVLVAETAETKRPFLEGDKVKACKDELGVLAGQVFIIPYHHDETERGFAERTVKKLRQIISSGEERDANVTALRAQTLAELNRGRTAGVTILATRFELFRTGELRVVLEDDESDALARQVYYFIKDASHRHYHHRRSSDNLLPFSRTTPEDDETWRRNTLWALTRTVLEARRRDKLEGYKSAIGILAYAEAFQGLLGRVKRQRGRGIRFGRLIDPAPYDFAHTRASLEAKIGEHEYRASSQASSFGLWLSTGLATTALWISAVQIRASVCSAMGQKQEATCSVTLPTWTAHWSAGLISHPIYAYGVLTVIALLYLSRRELSFAPIAAAFGGVEAWSQALGASVSRAVAKRHPEIGDRVGAYFAAATLATIWALVVATLIWLLRLR